MRFITLREGVRNRVYRDSRGFPTVGIGHLLVGAERRRYPVGTVVSQAQLDRWFAQDSAASYRVAEQQAQSMGLAGNTRAVEIFGSMSYQLGNGWPTKFPSLVRQIRARQIDAAIRTAQTSRWARQTPVRVRDLVQFLQTLRR